MRIVFVIYSQEPNVMFMLGLPTRDDIPSILDGVNPFTGRMTKIGYVKQYVSRPDQILFRELA
jgi:hypothetical protein